MGSKCHCSNRDKSGNLVYRFDSSYFLNGYCQAVGCYDALESHKRYSPVDNMSRM